MAPLVILFKAPTPGAKAAKKGKGEDTKAAKDAKDAKKM